MAEAPGIAIVGAGLLTALGQSAQSYAAMRAGFSGVQVLEDTLLAGPDAEWDPPSELSAAPSALPASGGEPWERLVALALPALDEALCTAGLTRRDWPGISLHLCLRAPQAPRTAEVHGAQVTEALATRGGLPRPGAARVHFAGHAAGAVALAAAVRDLGSGACRQAVVGGIESFVDGAELARLDRDFRLKSERSPDGHSPGEVAAFVVLETVAAARTRGVTPLASVGAPVLAAEPHPLGSDTPCAGVGLGEALRGLPGTLPGWFVSDQNGERHRAKEWALVRVRLAKRFADEPQLWHPAKSFGDAGAASLPLFAALACEAFRRGDAPGSAAALLTSSDGPERAALVLSATAQGRN